MKEKITLSIFALMLAIIATPVLAQQGQEQTAGQSNSEKKGAQIQVQERDPESVGSEDGKMVTTQTREEIKTVTVNQGEDNQLEVKTENVNQEQTRLELDEDEIVSIELQNKAEDNMLQVRRNTDSVYIKNGDADVNTRLSFEIDTETGEILVTTASGKEVSIGDHPSQMLSKVLETGIIDNLEEMNLTESESNEDQVLYEVTGTCEKKFLGFFTVTSEISATYDAETGEEITVEKPWYLDLFSFLFSK